MIDFAELRRGMVDGQVRTNDVTDHRIIAAMLEIPRERFVPASLKSLAYIDDDLQIRAAGSGAVPRFLLEPMILARLVQLADIEAGEHVLDVGAGTGYSSALLSRLAQQVVALEEDPDLAAAATSTLADLGVDNVAVMQGPLAAGWASEAPYDCILLNGAVDEVPAALFAQLKEGGRLIAVVGGGGAGRACVFTKVAGQPSERIAFNAAVPALPGFEAPQRFVF
ncbi:protein-L-isoaspartate O-methyltransferase family protein [Xanthobacter tagetidis]|jgi:protein-L-isoaspartate(D-aspartate) O-methyltransferase|uniref:Protein-L-isoaspartate O-methyltransferase n=1 Tax=Xanthobacter tagetidis TaxID=60216 RepID=A0A3L7ANH1_9HYPH|nr:protein-L-isoaspartate O-methyltransferase [Xanthobacter tagetidis]MBB6307605.1 protein-L-isoaspartate(D-aspartate) O-methyltransferase [Xanthobacter tagetidis]RLP81171.1 protein-L-isoaspartate O-methyltransferase [Xanthobacter tagetidis]